MVYWEGEGQQLAKELGDEFWTAEMRRGGPQREFCEAKASLKGADLKSADESMLVLNFGQGYLKYEAQAQLLGAPGERIPALPPESAFGLKLGWGSG